jgi:hypothetical protein
MSVKRKLIIVARAGSSIDFGMLRVEEVNSFFLKSAHQYFLLANDHNKNLYGYIYDEVERQLSSNTMLGQRRKPNFEDILYVIYTLAGLHSAQAPLGAFIGIRRFPDVVYIGQLKRVDEHMLRHLGQHLVDSLLDALRKQCQEPASHFAELKNLLAALAEEFDVALVTTNYDDLLYRAFPQGIETGFDLGITVCFVRIEFCGERLGRASSTFMAPFILIWTSAGMTSMPFTGERISRASIKIPLAAILSTPWRETYSRHRVSSLGTERPFKCNDFRSGHTIRNSTVWCTGPTRHFSWDMVSTMCI